MKWRGDSFVMIEETGPLGTVNTELRGRAASSEVPTPCTGALKWTLALL